jgi:tetratricopeptide (TPR) repeat protein
VLDISLLTAISEVDATSVHDALAELLTRQVLEDGGPGLRFVHEKLREHAYDSIPEERRRQIHLHVAEAVEAREADASHLLAFHFHAGGRPDRALPHAIAAGRQARAAGALHDAHDQLTRALRLESESARVVGPLPPLERARLRSSLGEARVAVGDIDGGGEILREAYTIVRHRSIPRGSTRWLLFLLGQLLVQLRHRFVPPRPARAPAPARAELEEAASIANRMGFSFMVKGQHLPMLGVLTLAANLAERAGALPVRGIPYSILGSTFGAMGARKLSQSYFASSRAAVANSRVALLQQAQVEGYYYLTRGQWQAARAVLEPAYLQGQQMGIPHDTEALGIARALLEILTGHPDRARTLLEEVRRTAEILGHRLNEWWAGRYEALALVQEGRPREALERAAPAEVGFRERGGILDLINVLAIRAIAYHRLGEPAPALDLVKQAHALAQAHGGAADHSFELHAYGPEILLRAWADAQKLGLPEAAALERAAQRSLKAAARYARLFPIGRPTFLLNGARSATVRGKPREAERLLARAQAAAEELHMPLGPL